MERRLSCDLCVIGAGAGGLSVAAGAARLGARVVLVEARAMGGDCLRFGCIPSKSLLAAAARAAMLRQAPSFGVRIGAVDIDFEGVRRHIAGVIASIEPQDSEERFERLGVRVLHAHARFVGPTEVEAEGLRIRARRFVIATGSRPAVPPVPGLSRVPFHTNETIFSLEELPAHLLVIGAGAIGCELAQAFRRLGAEVSIVDVARMLPREDAELAGFVRGALVEEGVRLFEEIDGLRVEDGPMLVFRHDGRERRLSGSALLLAAGRRPNVENLGLEEAGIRYDAGGIKVDSRLRTTNRRVFALGDVIGGALFTHAASHQAGIVIRNTLFRCPARARLEAVPRVLFTDPELAQSGHTEAEASGQACEIVRLPFSENDRARCEGATRGLVKLVIGRRGRILGAGIVGRHAGELLAPLVLAQERRMPLSALASSMLPYPTLSELVKRAAGRYYEPMVFGPWAKRIVRALTALG